MCLTPPAFGFLCMNVHGCVFIIQRQRLINTRTLTNGDSDVPVKGGSRRGIENGLSGAERGVLIHHDDREVGNETENEDNENNENDEEEEEEDGEGPFVPFQCPGTNWRWIHVECVYIHLFCVTFV